MVSKKMQPDSTPPLFVSSLFIYSFFSIVLLNQLGIFLLLLSLLADQEKYLSCLFHLAWLSNLF